MHDASKSNLAAKGITQKNTIAFIEVKGCDVTSQSKANTNLK